jgi:anti-sigma regulatory factor (Ser/Thr protein kinase)
MPPVRGTIDLEFCIAAGLSAPAAARRCVERLSESVNPDLLDDIKFLVNELVTNSIQHACAPGDWIGLELTGDRECVRVMVSDEGPGFDGYPRLADPEDTSGRGLYLVSRMSDSWGVECNERTNVWFEIRPEKANAASN